VPPRAATRTRTAIKNEQWRDRQLLWFQNRLRAFSLPRTVEQAAFERRSVMLRARRLGPRVHHAFGLSVLLWCASCDVYDANLTKPVSAPAAPSDDTSMSSISDEDGGSCDAAAEVCNGRDDDCDGTIDESDADRSCGAPHADAVCRDGQCLIVRCLAGHRDCDQLAADGCEIEPDDLAHCESCDRSCSAEHGEASCIAAHCRVVHCEAGWDDCDGDHDSCETHLDSPLHCGACDVACAAPAHALAVCRDGECQNGGCEPGWGDCDGNADNGCEQRLDTLQHCGACGHACSQASCEGGVCTPLMCGDGVHADCDGDGQRCESDLDSDVMHCGSCENRCRFLVLAPNAQFECARGACQVVCDEGFGDCDGVAADGCETRLNGPAACGACAKGCSIPGAVATCASGSCRVLRCDADHGDCDGDQLSCETALDSVEHCGACDNACRPAHGTGRCLGSGDSRACAIASCDTNYSDCDGVAANGCERDIRSPDAGGMGACLPDVGCKTYALDTRTFYVCPTARSWADARLRCQSQANGELAHVHDTATSEFVRSKLSGASWFGANDQAIEGTWAWSFNGVPFWKGTSSGAAIGMRYTQWAQGEPRGDDCATIDGAGAWAAAACTSSLPYVCEVVTDTCPTDPMKLDPGQCGCGRPDTDADGDGVAECPAK
jgi:hypothetical protein